MINYENLHNQIQTLINTPKSDYMHGSRRVAILCFIANETIRSFTTPFPDEASIGFRVAFNKLLNFTQEITSKNDYRDSYHLALVNILRETGKEIYRFKDWVGKEAYYDDLVNLEHLLDEIDAYLQSIKMDYENYFTEYIRTIETRR